MSRQQSNRTAIILTRGTHVVTELFKNMDTSAVWIPCKGHNSNMVMIVLNNLP